MVASANAYVPYLYYTDDCRFGSPRRPEPGSERLERGPGSLIRCKIWSVGVCAVAVGLFLLAVAAARADEKGEAKAPKEAPKLSFVALYAHGPKWVKDKGIGQQPGIEKHGRYMAKLFTAGSLSHGGPFSDSSGGMTILLAKDLAAAKELVAQDPAIKSGPFKATSVRAWHKINWAAFAARIEKAKGKKLRRDPHGHRCREPGPGSELEHEPGSVPQAATAA